MANEEKKYNNSKKVEARETRHFNSRWTRGADRIADESRQEPPGSSTYNAQAIHDQKTWKSRYVFKHTRWWLRDILY